jgi:hypothetical protein
MDRRSHCYESCEPDAAAALWDPPARTLVRRLMILVSDAKGRRRRLSMPSERLHLNVTEGDPGPGMDLQSDVAVRRLPPIRIRVSEVRYLLAIQ